MTKKSRRKGVYHPKRGANHILDSTRDDFGKDEVGLPRKGIAGVHDIRKDPGYRRLLEEIDWYIAHAEGSEVVVSPMRREVDLRALFRLANLTAPQRQVMVLRVEGQSIEAIADCLRITPGAVQQRLNWARLKFKVLLADIEVAAVFG